MGRAAFPPAPLSSRDRAVLTSVVPAAQRFALIRRERRIDSQGVVGGNDGDRERVLEIRRADGAVSAHGHPGKHGQPIQVDGGGPLDVRGRRVAELPDVPGHGDGNFRGPELGHVVLGAGNPIPREVVGFRRPSMPDEQHDGDAVAQGIGLNQSGARWKLADTHMIGVEEVREAFDVFRTKFNVVGDGRALGGHVAVAKIQEE